MLWLSILRLAWRDYRREFLLSACAVLGLAAVLTPLLVLYGVKFGVVQTLTDRLRNDPRNLEISPVSSGRFTDDDIMKLKAHPRVAFVIPRTRVISAVMELRSGAGAERRAAMVSLEPTDKGDPLLRHFQAAVPAAARRTPDAPYALEATLSAPAAEKLGVAPGDMLEGRVERSSAGRPQSARVPLRVAAVLPLAAQQKDVAYVPFVLMRAAEDYRDGYAVPGLPPDMGWTGDAPATAPSRYAGFRLYARTLDDVPLLRDAFAAQRIDVYTHAEEIDQVTSLARALNCIFALICAATAAGFLASTASSALAGVKRKERVLGLLRLHGFTTGKLVLFPLAQSLLTALLGTATASGVYAAAAAVINQLFRADVTGMEQVCRLLPQHFLLAFAAVAALALLAAVGPAVRAARVEPSEVIREV